MALYMSQFSYTSEAWAALAQHPVNRAEASSQLVRSLGGRLVDMYYCFGEYDGICLFEAPDEASAAAIAIAAVGAGHLKANRITPLLTIDQAMEAMRKAGAFTLEAPSAIPTMAR